MYLAILMVLTVAAGIADFMLLTNFKASVLMALGTAFALILNYNMTIGSISETQKELYKEIFPSWNWFKVECNSTAKAFACAVGFVSIIILFWYWPRDYSINWTGLLITLMIVVLTSFISGFLGTKRGIQKYST